MSNFWKSEGNGRTGWQKKLFHVSAVVSQNFKNPENMSLIYTEVLCMLEKPFKGDAAFVHGEQTQEGTQKDQGPKNMGKIS